ncbi:MAG: hypothetical protein KME38_20020 [Spirirestis rafaelensis WJT71-NPBG6]|jgi:hypothetical protein|nr:hypothetical protein [Spirirestis rafaelensis WJT71-NPBG6]
MKKRLLRIIRVVFKSVTFKFLKLLSKLSHAILTLKSQIEKALRKLGNKQENHFQQETDEVSRKIGEPTITPQPTQPPTPVRLKNELHETEEISRRIGEPRVDPQPTKPPTPIRVRRVTEPRVTPRPKQPPNPIRLRKVAEVTITSRTTFVGLRKIGVATVNPRPKKSPRPVR